MKLKFDEKLFKFSKYIIVTAILIYLSFMFMNNIGSILSSVFATISYTLALISPLITAIIIAYLFYPLSSFIESKISKIKLKPEKTLEKEEIIKKDTSKPKPRIMNLRKTKKTSKESAIRMLSIFICYLLILGIIFAIIIGAYIMIGGQITKNFSIETVISSIVSYWQNTITSDLTLSENLDNLDIPFLDLIKPQILDIISSVQEYLSENIVEMTSSIVTIGSNIANFIVAIVISIYLLKDMEYFLNLWNKLYFLLMGDRKSGKAIKYVSLVFHQNFSQFIRGQLLEALAVGVMSSIALTILKVDYALIIGLIAGIMNMIPYVGPAVGTILACLMSLFNGDLFKVVLIIVVMSIIQFIDGNLLAPKIIGDSVGLHPVFIMVAIIVGGYLSGLIGMLMAVPIAASIRTLFNNWYTPNRTVDVDISIETE